MTARAIAVEIITVGPPALKRGRLEIDTTEFESAPFHRCEATPTTRRGERVYISRIQEVHRMAKRRRSPAPKAEFTGTCASGICDPVRTQGLKAPAPNGTYDLVS